MLTTANAVFLVYSLPLFAVCSHRLLLLDVRLIRLSSAAKRDCDHAFFLEIQLVHT